MSQAPECSVEHCDRKARSRKAKYCGAHYQRWLKGAPLDTPIREPRPPACSVKACGRPHYAFGLCNTHRYRQLHGIPLDRPISSPGIGRICDVKGCGEKHVARGYCARHYERATRRSHLGIDSPFRRPIRSGDIGDAPGHVDRISVAGAHMRVRALWGSAAQYPCFECGGPARDWAYDGADPTERYGKNGNGNSFVFYSRFPEFYMPMCAPCHRRRDKLVAARELYEYRAWKHRTRMTLPELDLLLTRLDLESVA